ncbi:DUF4190 domain-containing protein [Blastococcus tunisiensis]|uniref:DUF4190 domain-containing protein n=1 Tax=Blastococcus tunisiensis TaxID=1798228 RepID=A0A1I2LNL3_9ACTN|nr:DUF4190 domain-containing protein [Blastococcus sp. DSM 46838]SFF80019.1 protein of unknown function [Blastococcus sp. DSM 46838]
MSYPPQAPYQQEYGPPSYGQPAGPPPKQGAGLAIASMVLGIVALLLSWIPIINNVAAIVAIVGLGLGIPALIRARRGTHNGAGMAITGLVTSVLAIVLVILTQMLFVKAIDEVEKSIDESLAEVESAPAEPGADKATAETTEVVPLGVPAQVGDYQVTLDAIELDANATVAAANQFNEPPTGQYVITQLTVTYVGAEEGMPAFDLTAVFHGTDSRQYSDSECSAVLPDDAMDAPTLNSGGSDTFQFCMDVPPAAIQGGQLSIEPTLSFTDERVYYAIG